MPDPEQVHDDGPSFSPLTRYVFIDPILCASRRAQSCGDTTDPLVPGASNLRARSQGQHGHPRLSRNQSGSSSQVKALPHPEPALHPGSRGQAQS